MYSFCPHCGDSIGQEQIPGKMLVCRNCGREIGMVTPNPRTSSGNVGEPTIPEGAARCPACGQAVEMKTRGAEKTFGPHYAPGQKRICPQSGKPLVAAAPASPSAAPPPPSSGSPRVTSSGKDLSAFYKKDVIRVILCPKAGAPTIEELTLEYLDKADRVRTQIEAIRDLLGPDFRMAAYPLNRPGFAVWRSAAALLIGKKHDQGGLQTLTDAEITQVVQDVTASRSMFR